MPLINCEIKCAGRFATTATKLYVPAVTSPAQNNTKLIQQLKFDFQRTISWKKFQSIIATEAQNQYLDFILSLKMKTVERHIQNIIFQK